jgi:predicted DNA-binding transcriptional regulator AlpA
MSSPFLRPKFLVEYLQIGRATLYRRMKYDPTFPTPIRHGRVTVFSRAEIDKWLLANQGKPSSK